MRAFNRGAIDTRSGWSSVGAAALNTLPGVRISLVTIFACELARFANCLCCELATAMGAAATFFLRCLLMTPICAKALLFW